jgi:hypothetical protein
MSWMRFSHSQRANSLSVSIGVSLRFHPNPDSWFPFALDSLNGHTKLSPHEEREHQRAETHDRESEPVFEFRSVLCRGGG